MKMTSRHLVSIDDLSRADIQQLLQLAAHLRDVTPVDLPQDLRGRLVINGFFENSTRTRLSFEIAAKRLGAHVVNISAIGSSMKKGETLEDTIRNIAAMGPDALVMRYEKSGAVREAAQWFPGPVINAGDGVNEHPTQALLDLFTILQHKPAIKDLHIGIIGDILHSRVARSNMLLLRKMGAKVSVAGPDELIPDNLGSLAKVSPDIDKMIPELDVLMTLRIQHERLGEHCRISLAEYSQRFCLTEARLKRAKRDLIVMHPGPANRGIEIASAVMDGSRSVILQQVTNGVAMRMAVLMWLLKEKGT